MPEKQIERFDTIDIRQAKDSGTRPQDGDVGVAGLTSESGVAGLGLALYAGSTVFNSGQSTLAKLIGKQPGAKDDVSQGRFAVGPMQDAQTCHRAAGQHGVPVFETVLTRSVFILLCAALPILVNKTSPRGKQ